MRPETPLALENSVGKPAAHRGAKCRHGKESVANGGFKTTPTCPLRRHNGGHRLLLADDLGNSHARKAEVVNSNHLYYTTVPGAQT
jgi:hypothetical protein